MIIVMSFFFELGGLLQDVGGKRRVRTLSELDWCGQQGLEYMT
jgi:hypothetical protein